MEMDPKRAGWLSIVAALLTPSWWILPQVLAGLGLFGLLSASCLFWLERLQPLFLAVALGALAYQVWAVRRRPPFLRTLGVKVILGVSLTVNLSLIGAWIVLWFRYRWYTDRGGGVFMNSPKGMLAALLWVVVMGVPAFAQVERVVADASGITWQPCAAVMEIALRRLDGVDKISISISRQTFEVTYKPGSSFRPGDLRDAVAKAEVKVVQFNISARGQVKVENSKRFFLAGKDKFLLVNSAQVPAGVPLSILGTVDDSAEPFQLRIRDFTPLKP